MAFILNPGDEVVFTRRRVQQVEKVNEDGTTSKVDQVELSEFGAVRCPDHLEIQAGEAGVEWDEDKRFLTVKWRCA